MVFGFGKQQIPDEQFKALMHSLGQLTDPGTGIALETLDWLKDPSFAPNKAKLSLGCPFPNYEPHTSLKQTLTTKLEDAGFSKITIDSHLAPPSFRGGAKRLLPGVANVIAVASGKGGVGKSTVSMNLALSLSQMGFDVGFMDCDIYGPSLPAMIGVRPKPRTNQKQQIVPHKIHQLVTMSMGFLLDPGQAATWRGPMVHKMIQQFLFNVAWGELDFLILDLPPGTGDVQLSLTQESPLTAAVVVTTPQEAALADARKGIEMFRKADVPVLGFVENMATYTCKKCQKEHHLFQKDGGQQLATEYALPLIAQLPLDPKIPSMGTDSSPIVARSPKSDTAQLFNALAQEVCLNLLRLSASWQPTQPQVMEV